AAAAAGHAPSASTNSDLDIALMTNRADAKSEPRSLLGVATLPAARRRALVAARGLRRGRVVARRRAAEQPPGDRVVVHRDRSGEHARLPDGIDHHQVAAAQ